MKSTKCLRRYVLNAALSIACLAVAASASAQEWPSRNITVVVPLGAGTASDVTARVVMGVSNVACTAKQFLVFPSAYIFM